MYCCSFVPQSKSKHPRYSCDNIAGIPPPPLTWLIWTVPLKMSPSTRVTFPCYAYAWSRPSSNTGQQGWLYYNPQMIAHNLLRPALETMGSGFEILDELPEPDLNLTDVPEIQALYDGKADMSVDMYALEYRRYRLVDFINPIEVRKPKCSQD